MTSELNKFTLNNEIVLMRHDIRKARVSLVHKITRNIETLRAGKGSKEPTEKDLLKADKLVDEIRTLKKLEDDRITKTLLVYADDPEKVLSDIRKTLEDRVIAKLFTIKSMQTSISKFRRKYPNWLEDVPALLKTMKQKNPRKKIKDNPKESESNYDKPATLKTKKCENSDGESGIVLTSTSGSWTVIDTKRIRVDSSMEGGEDGGQRKVIGENIGIGFENRQKINKVSWEGGKKFKSNNTKLNMEKDEDSFGSRKKSGERIESFDNEKEKFKIGKKIGFEPSENGIEDIEERLQLTKKVSEKSGHGIDRDLEKRFKNNKKTDKAESSKKKEEIKVADPFFMTNDNSEYLTVVSSKEQAEAVQNPSKTSSNYRNDDEELYYGSSLTGGFKQISHHERRKSMVTNLSRGSTMFADKNHREFGKGGGRRNEGNFKNRESSSSSSHALPRRERRKLLNGGGKETKMEEEEKLHPSWEAKRRQSCPAIPQFSGKKIVFDD